MGICIGDKITVTLDLAESTHKNPWIDLDAHYFESEEALKLGICISGLCKKVGSEMFGKPFVKWVRRRRNSPSSMVIGHPSVNAAMTIVEWLRGEEQVPVPANRIVISEGNRRLTPYYGTEYTGQKRGYPTEYSQRAIEQYKDLRKTENGGPPIKRQAR